MNWKLQILVSLGNLFKPKKIRDNFDIKKLRHKGEKGAAFISFLFDSFIPVKEVKNFRAANIPVRLYKISDNIHQAVIIYFHGGGFVLRSINTHDNVCRRLCKMNDVIVLSVDYRMAPEHIFPSAQEDAFTIIKWVAGNIHNYGGNKNLIVVAGDSAGGNLAACAAHKFKDQKEINIKAMILIYPWLDGRLDADSVEKFKEGYLLTKEKLLWFRENYTPVKGDINNPKAWPVNEEDFRNLPETFLATAGSDALKDDGKLYYTLLKKDGNNVIYKEYKQMIHGFIHMPKIAAEALNIYTDIKIFLKRIIG